MKIMKNLTEYEELIGRLEKEKKENQELRAMLHAALLLIETTRRNMSALNARFDVSIEGGR